MPRRRGLSPRVRGNQILDTSCNSIFRSIPACTGEPVPPHLRHPLLWVYPRVYGGTNLLGVLGKLVWGLSPRVRGNQFRQYRLWCYMGSIPACTGEPPLCGSQRITDGVYPRVYGGTTSAHCPLSSYPGLSPRVRGNPGSRCAGRGDPGSIPACTGEPSLSDSIMSCPQVYPRVYGGTRSKLPFCHIYTGLSPRVRGNLFLQGREKPWDGSIPACTGEPRGHGRGGVCGQVYPRVYGGTSVRVELISAGTGLSPRVRGNQTAAPGHRRSPRSIPACTGEPIGSDSRPSSKEVYPRVYGGTRAAHVSWIRGKGLSPRVRGNLVAGRHFRDLPGSIPACTGEPPFPRRAAY